MSRSRGRIGAIRALFALVACAVAAAGLVGCRAEPQRDPGAETRKARGAGSKPILPRTRPQSFMTRRTDGGVVTGTLALSAPFPASRAGRLVDAFPSGLPCPNIDPTRDALIYGTIAFHNEKPEFAPKLRAALSPPVGRKRLHPLEVGIGYSNNPVCANKSSKVQLLAIRPQFTSADWGPVPLLIVIRGLYSPGHLRGDLRVASEASMTFVVSGAARGGRGGLRFKPATAGGARASGARVDLPRHGS
jgi:hypothetical protein